MLAIPIIAEGGASFIAASRQMVAKPGTIHAQKSGHGAEPNLGGTAVNSNVDCSKLTLAPFPRPLTPLELGARSVPVTQEGAVIESFVLRVQLLTHQLQLLPRTISQFEQQIAAVYRARSKQFSVQPKNQS